MTTALHDAKLTTAHRYFALSFFLSRHIVRGIITQEERGSRDRDSRSTHSSASSSLI